MRAFIRNTPFAVLLIAPMLLAAAALADDGGPTTFDQVVERYEAVRLALAHDTTDGISEQGQEIEAILERLSTEWSPAAAGVRAEQAEEIRGLLPELSQAAAALAEATSLETARDAFYALSKPLVRWHRAADAEKPVVAYCAMAKRSWLQPEGELGNPYYGQSMLRCGEVVDS